MAKKKYMRLVYFRQAEWSVGYWYAIHPRSCHAKVAVHYARSIKLIKGNLLTFPSLAAAKEWMALNKDSLPNMTGGEWEIVSKSIPAPVSGAQRNLSRQYCQKKRQLAGVVSMLKPFCTTPASKEWLSKIVQLENKYLTFDYKAALKQLKQEEKKND